MASVPQAWITDAVYNMLYLHLREQNVNKRDLSSRSKSSKVNENLLTLDEREKYFMRLYAMYGGNVNRVAKVAEVPYRRARRTLDICIRKMLSPRCLVRAKAIPEFKHLGDSLMLSKVMSNATINRLKQSGIETDLDLLYWYNLGPEFLFRIPEVAKGRVVEILNHLNSKSMI